MKEQSAPSPASLLRPAAERSPRPAPTISLSARTVGRALGVLIALLALLNLVAIVALDRGALANNPDLARLFTLDLEGNVPTWISSALLLVSAALLALHGRLSRTSGGGYARHWYGLSLLFVLLSLDETVSLHESTAWWVRQIAELRGPFFYAWVVPAMLFVALLGLALLPFLRHLRRPTRWRMVLAAALYLSGALGMEMVAASYMDGYEVADLRYLAMSSVEELLELAGVSVFIYALLFHLEQRGRALTIRGAP